MRWIIDWHFKHLIYMHVITLLNIMKTKSIAPNFLPVEYMVIENAKDLIQAVK